MRSCSVLAEKYVSQSSKLSGKTKGDSQKMTGGVFKEARNLPCQLFTGQVEGKVRGNRLN